MRIRSRRKTRKRTRGNDPGRGAQQDMRLVFMGTPDIAAAALEALIGAGHEIAGVFTREDKPVGRKQVLTPPPVKVLAQRHGIPVFQPKTLRDGEAERILRGLAPELIAVVAYGRILPKEILALPRFGCVNLHVSLLPKYRGAAPIQWAVLNGETETGVTIIQMDEGMDTGDILAVAPVEIGPEETSADVFEKVTALGAETLARTVAAIGAGRVRAVPQEHEKATSAPPLKKEMAAFDFSQDAKKLHNLIRGLYPWPVAQFTAGGVKVKVNRARAAAGVGAPGEVLSLKPLTVACGAGALELLEVVPQGKRPMTGQEWAAGRRLKKGDFLRPEV